MEVPIESVFASNFADDFAPLSLGSFASRVTLIDPHAVANAAADLKKKIREYAAETGYRFALTDRIAGLPYLFGKSLLSLLPEDYEGWGLFRAVDDRVAELEEEAHLPSQLQRRLPRTRALLVGKSS